MNLLNNINSPVDLRTLSENKLPQLANELRAFIIDIVSSEGGHLGASLGVVELTIALHYVFDTPNDLLVWDVGHQAYGHKILTERKAVFKTNRKLNGLSGFPKRSESQYDAFGVGHSSTSISAVLGMAIASKLKNEEKQHIAVIGDASITSGMAFEALNHAGNSDTNLLIILNDNAIGIDPSVGALKEHFKNISSEDNIFKNLNIDYTGIVNGHNINDLLVVLKSLKNKKGVKLLHIKTTKGKGLAQAEKEQVVYHAPGKFDKISGKRITQKTKFTKFQDVFGETLVELASKNDKIVGITPAMLTGSSLNLLQEKFPERTFDVGIAEQHAVTLSAGMATQGLIPFCNIYSSFMQRAYDQIIHDVALQNLPVVFCLDRAGLVGEDGATHHGVFDLAYLRCIPNIIIFAPRNEIDLRNMLFTAQLGLDNPIAIRYPRGYGKLEHWKKAFEKIEIGKGICLKKGQHTAILSIGTISENVTEAIQKTKASVSHYDIRFLKPLDEDLLHDVFKNHTKIITIEDGSIKGGLGSSVVEFAQKNKYQSQIETLGIPDKFIEHGSISELQKICSIDVDSIVKLL